MTCLDQKSSCLQPDYHKTSHGSPGGREWRREDGERGKREGREREREKERVVCTVPMHAALPDCQLGLVVIESIVKLA